MTAETDAVGAAQEIDYASVTAALEREHFRSLSDHDIRDDLLVIIIQLGLPSVHEL
jgi:hypothetical protein